MTADALPTIVAAPVPKALVPNFVKTALRGLRGGLIAAGVLLLIAACADLLLKPLLASANVVETFTTTVANLCAGLMPVAFYVMGGIAARRLRAQSFIMALLCAWLVAALGYGVLTAYQATQGTGAFREAPTLNFQLRQVDGGIEVVSVDADGAAAAAGVQVGDIITALRRDVLTAPQLEERIAQAAPDDVFRLRITRGEEELQLTPRIRLVSSTDTGALLRGLLAALAIGLVALIMPTSWSLHLVLIASLVPLLVGYFWLVIATFSQRTHGLFPVDATGAFGGFTLANWDFLGGANIGAAVANIWTVTLNSLTIAISMTVVSLAICSMAGYALSRMVFPGRRMFLSMTLVLHGFPAVTLIIPIFLVLINLGNLPVIGNLIGYNSVGGVALVMIAFELPLGVWLMKGFFDTISWDMERSALIDGATRWRTFREIILPQIRPGLLALGIFSFIGGWNAYLIPATFSIGTGLSNLPVFIRQLSGELAPVNWNQVAAVGLFQLIPIFAFFIFAQEYLLNIYAGGTKGSS